MNSDELLNQALVVPQPWDDVDSLYNWRVCIGEQTRAIWDTFTDEQKIAIAHDADIAFCRQEALLDAYLQ